MTEVEAEKILDFLAKRYERRTNTLIEEFSIDHSTDNLIVNLKHYGSCCVWKLNHIEPNYYGGNRVKIYGEMTTTNVVSCLFNCAKIYDLNVCGETFVSKGESLEELLVKADLEDF